MDYLKLLEYAPQAKGVYGNGAGTPALATGNFVPVEVDAFKDLDGVVFNATFKAKVSFFPSITLAGIPAVAHAERSA